MAERVRPINETPISRQRLADACAAQSPGLFRIAWAILRDGAAAEDACQEAFVRACECRDEIADLGQLNAWLKRVVVNECLRVLRRRKVESQSLQAQRVALREAGNSGFGSRDESYPMHVTTELSRLPDVTRAVVSLRVVEGLSGNETAALLGCSPAEVSRQLYAGMETLRARLTDEIR